MAPVTDLAAATYENLQLRGVVLDGRLRELQLQQQLLHSQRRGVTQLLTTQLDAMRTEAGAGETDTYDPPTKTFTPTVPAKALKAVPKGK